MILSAAYCISFHLSWTLHIFICKIMIVFCIIIFSKRNTCTFAVRNFAILNDPSFAPVRSDHTILISCRRSPGSCCFCNYEATDCDISHTGFGWHKTLTAYVYLYIFFIWICSMEIRINDCLVFLLVLFCIPFISRLFRNPAALINLSFDAFLYTSSFIKSTVIKIYTSCVFVSFGKIQRVNATR